MLISRKYYLIYFASLETKVKVAPFYLKVSGILWKVDC